MDPTGPPSWRGSLSESGGWVTNDLGSHLIDLVLWLSGSPAILIGAALATQRFAVETEDTAALLMSLGGQAIGIVETSAANASPGSRIEIYGDGWIRAENTLTGAASVSTSAGAHATFAEPGPRDAYAAQIDDFLAAVRGGASIGADGDEARLVVDVLDAALAGGVRMRRSGR